MTLVLPGCALRNQTSANVAPVASVVPSKAQHCPDRVDRSRTGGFVGGVLGTVAASLIGSPFLGVLYRTAGSVIGFASEGNCPNREAPPEGKSAPLKNADPRSSAAIGEEDL